MFDISRRAAADERGTIAAIFALGALVLVGMVGIALDYGQGLRTQSHLQQSSDSAALAAASTASSYIASHSQSADVVTGAELQATLAANQIFAGNAAGWKGLTPTATVDVQLVSGVVTANVTSRLNLATSFGKLFGVSSIQLGAFSTATVRLRPYVSVSLLIDTSGSMALGASASDQTWLQTNIGCAFACHDNAPVNGYADAYAYALANGITLRYGAVNQGILSLMDKVDQLDPGHQFISTTVFSFDNALTVNASATTDTSLVRRNLPTAPATSSMTDGATHFREVINDVILRIGPSGDGSSASSPIKLLIIATDGAQDPGRYWTSDVPARAQVGAFDMSFCGPAKSSGLKIGIIHTPYQPMTYDWGYLATLGQPGQYGGVTRADDIPTVLQGCAGDYYVQANDSSAIRAAFTSIFGEMGTIALKR